MSSYRQFLGTTEVAPPPTYSPDEMKNVRAFTDVNPVGQYNRNKEYYTTGKFTAGGTNYQWAPWNWIDIPRNQLERKGKGESISNNDGTSFTYKWTGGRGFVFKNPNIYLNGLMIITDPKSYIQYLKLAPLAGFNITGSLPKQTAQRGSLDVAYNGKYAFELPKEATIDWWKEVVTFWALGKSFEILRMAQIEDVYDLEAAYKNTGKLIDELKAEMRSDIPVDVLPDPRSWSGKGFRAVLALQTWQIENLDAGINEVRMLIDENRKKMAKRVIELSDPDAKIVETSFSTDSLSNPYLVYNPAAHSFTNVARNLSVNWKPAPVAADPVTKEYWEKVPEYEAENARVYETEYGLMSAADLRKYGLDRQKTNWLPWLAAGAAVAYAATEML